MAHVNKMKQKPAIKNESQALNIDYVGLIDALNKSAFRFFVQQVFPIYNYRILSVEEIRPIDMKENLLRLAVPGSDKDRKLGAANYLGRLLRGWFKSLDCKKGSRASFYRNRVIEILEGPALNYADLEDAVITFTVLFREEVLLRATKQKITGINLDLTNKDAKLLALILEKDYRNRLKQAWNVLSSAELEQTVKFMYINCMLIISKVLMDRGELVMGEK